MNKRGFILSVYLVGGLMFVAALMVIIVPLVSKASNPTVVREILTSSDVAKTIDVSQSTPFDFYYEYPKSLTDYDVIIDGNDVLLAEKGQEPNLDFSFSKSSFSKTENLKIDEEQRIDAAYFYIQKNGNELIILDSKKDNSGSVLIETNKEKPSVRLEIQKDVSLSVNKVLDKILISLKSELERSGYEVKDDGDLIISFSSLDEKSSNDNKIYYSLYGEQDSKELSNIFQKLFSDRMSLSVIPTPKDYGEQKTIELAILNNYKNLGSFDDDTSKVLASLMILTLDTYYGGSN